MSMSDNYINTIPQNYINNHKRYFIIELETSGKFTILIIFDNY